MEKCDSFHFAQAVSIEKEKAIEGDSWQLSLHWNPHHSETECLKKIVEKRGLEMIELNERTIFRSF